MGGYSLLNSRITSSNYSNIFNTINFSSIS
nr:MAG TPA: hypothetical protein [Bacteriophage sp.]